MSIFQTREWWSAENSDPATPAPAAAAAPPGDPLQDGSEEDKEYLKASFVELTAFSSTLGVQVRA